MLPVPVAVLALLGGSAAFGADGAPGGAAAAQVLGGAAAVAALIAVAAVPIGFAGALALWRASFAMRLVAAALAVLLVAAPAPGFGAIDFQHAAVSWEAALALAACVARGAAVSLLLVGVGLRHVPPGLRRAAMLAGARPGQAWRHAVLAPVLPYLVAAALGAFALAMVEGPARALVAVYVDWPLAWIAPAALLAAVAALGAVLRPRRVGV